MFVGSNPIQAEREIWILSASESVSTSVSSPLVYQDSKPVTSSSRLSLGQYKLICRSGFVVLSDAAKIFIATIVALIVVNRNYRVACAHAVSARSARVNLLLRHSGGFVVSCLKKGKNFFETRITECQRAVRSLGSSLMTKAAFAAFVARASVTSLCDVLEV